MLKAAVIGVGSMGANHARVYKELPDVQLVGVADAHEPTARSVGNRFNVPSFSDYNKLLEETDPDLVTLAVPTVLHHEVALELISRGIHVLVEKPIASTVAQGEELVRAAAEKGVTLAVGHIERFNPAVVELRRRVSEGMMGRVYQVSARRLSPYPARIRDAGVVIDLASHDIDLMRYLIPSPISRLYGETAHSINSDREDLFNGVMRFANGVVGVLDVNWMTPKKVRALTITGARGYFTCDLLSQELFFFENEVGPSQWDQLSMLRGVAEGNILGIKISRQEPLVAELRDFTDAIGKHREPTVTGIDGLESLRIAMAFVSSSAKGQTHTEVTAP
jgi:UDP-N-acetylglucosamine 3-dehydrogenase